MFPIHFTPFVDSEPLEPSHECGEAVIGQLVGTLLSARPATEDNLFGDNAPSQRSCRDVW